jgi:hypothetical protein
MIRFARIRTALAALVLGSAVILPIARGVTPRVADAASGPNAAEAALIGTWHNTDPHTRSVTLLRITFSSFYNADRMDTWAKCSPADCYWGTQTVGLGGANLGPNSGSAYYWFNFDSQRNVVTVARNGAQLDVYVQITHLLWDSRPGSFTHFVFARGS